MCSFLHKAREEEVLLRAEKPTAQGETGFRVWDAGLCRASFFSPDPEMASLDGTPPRATDEV